MAGVTGLYINSLGKDMYNACPDIGVIIYNNKTVTQILLDDDDFVRFERIPNLCGSKVVGADLWSYMNCLISRWNLYGRSVMRWAEEE